MEVIQWKYVMYNRDARSPAWRRHVCAGL